MRTRRVADLRAPEVAEALSPSSVLIQPETARCWRWPTAGAPAPASGMGAVA
jgi:hypothetical protein